MGFNSIYIIGNRKCLCHCNIAICISIIKIMRCIWISAIIKTEGRFLATHHGRWCKSMFKCCVIQQRFYRRTRLTTSLSCSVKWAFFIISSTHQCFNIACSWIHSHKAYLYITIFVYRVINGFFCNFLLLGIQGSVYS